MKILFAIYILIGAVVCLVKGKDAYANDVIDEPCGSKDQDLSCLRDYFNKNGRCSVVSKENQTPFYDVPIPLYVPIVNLTTVLTRTYPSNLNGTIEKFYIDKSTNNLVMSINYHDLHCYSPEAILSFSQKGKEPKVISEFLRIYHPVVLTANIPLSSDGKITKKSLQQGTFSAYFLKENSQLHAGPKFSKSEDPVIRSSYEALGHNTQTALKEVFLTRASYYFIWYLQNYICNFNILPNVQFKYDTTVLNRILDNNSVENPTISKPCADNNDLTGCVRDYFERQASCNVQRRPDNEPVHRPEYKVYTPWVNMTAIVKSANVTGLDGTITDFYINKDTGNLVMAVSFEGISMKSPTTTLLIHERGRQPKVVTDYNRDLYPVTLTAVIPMKDGITSEIMEKSHVTAYFAAPNVRFGVGSRQSDSDDPEIAAIIEKLKKDPMTHVTEMFVTEAHRLFLAYLQKYICDFSISIDP